MPRRRPAPRRRARAPGAGLRVSTDKLLGVKPFKDGTSPKTARLLKRLKKVDALPAADRRAVLKLVDALLETRRRAGSR